LTGTVRLYDGDEWADANPGDFHYVPEGGIHAFKNESGAPASMLLLFSPGAARGVLPPARQPLDPSPGAARADHVETLADTAVRAAMSTEHLADLSRRDTSAIPGASPGVHACVALPGSPGTSALHPAYTPGEANGYQVNLVTDGAMG